MLLGMNVMNRKGISVQLGCKSAAMQSKHCGCCKNASVSVAGLDKLMGHGLPKNDAGSSVCLTDVAIAQVEKCRTSRRAFDVVKEGIEVST